VTEPGGAPDAPVGRPTGPPFGPAERRRWESAGAGAVPLAAVPRARRPADAQEPAGLSGSSVKRVRPYVRTGGRTRSRTELALETLVTVSGRPGRLANEYRNVVDLCGVPRSIAEVAALSALPVGVARVLVGDLAERGLLTVHKTRGQSGAADDMALMQRVLAGLRRL
jgi:hypothetical protein